MSVKMVQKTEWVEEVNSYTNSEGKEASYTTKSATFEASVAGVTKEFEATIWGFGPLDKAHTKAIFTARVGRGTKLHPTAATLWFKDGEWVLGLNVVVLNRQACIVGWREVQEGTSQHSGSVRYYKK